MDEDSGESECKREGCLEFRNNLKHLMTSTKRQTEDLQRFSAFKQEYDLLKHQLVSREELVAEISQRVEHAVNAKETAEAELKQLKSAAQFDKKRIELLQKEADDADAHKQSAVKWRDKYDSVCELAEKLSGNNQLVKEKFEASVKTLEAAGRRIVSLENQLSNAKTGSKELNEKSKHVNKYLKSAIQLIDALSSTANVQKQPKTVKDLLTVFRRDDVRLFFNSEPWKNSANRSEDEIPPDGTLSEEEEEVDEDDEDDEDVMRLEQMMTDSLVEVAKNPTKKPDFASKMRELRSKVTPARMVPTGNKRPANVKKQAKSSNAGNLDAKLVHSKHVPASDFDVLARASEARKKALLGTVPADSAVTSSSTATIHGRKGKTVREQQKEMMSGTETVKEKVARMRAEAANGKAAPNQTRSQSVRVRQVSTSSESIRRSSRVAGKEPDTPVLPLHDRSRSVSRKSSPAPTRSRSVSRTTPVTPSRSQRALNRDQVRTEQQNEAKKVEKKRPAPKPVDFGPPVRVTRMTSFLAAKKKNAPEDSEDAPELTTPTRSLRSSGKVVQNDPEDEASEIASEAVEIQQIVEDTPDVAEDAPEAESEAVGLQEHAVDDLNVADEVPEENPAENSASASKNTTTTVRSAPEEPEESEVDQDVSQPVQIASENVETLESAPEAMPETEITAQEVPGVHEADNEDSEDEDDFGGLVIDEGASEDVEKTVETSSEAMSAELSEPSVEPSKPIEEAPESPPRTSEDVSTVANNQEPIEEDPIPSRPSEDILEGLTASETPEKASESPRTENDNLDVATTSKPVGKASERSEPSKIIKKQTNQQQLSVFGLEISDSEGDDEDVPEQPQKPATSQNDDLILDILAGAKMAPEKNPSDSGSRQTKIATSLTAGQKRKTSSELSTSPEDDLALDILAGAKMVSEKKPTSSAPKKPKIATSTIDKAPETAVQKPVTSSKPSTSPDDDLTLDILAGAKIAPKKKPTTSGVKKPNVSTSTDDKASKTTVQKPTTTSEPSTSAANVATSPDDDLASDILAGAKVAPKKTSGAKKPNVATSTGDKTSKTTVQKPSTSSTDNATSPDDDLALDILAGAKIAPKKKPTASGARKSKIATSTADKASKTTTSEPSTSSTGDTTSPDNDLALDILAGAKIAPKKKPTTSSARKPKVTTSTADKTPKPAVQEPATTSEPSTSSTDDATSPDDNPMMETPSTASRDEQPESETSTVENASETTGQKRKMSSEPSTSSTDDATSSAAKKTILIEPQRLGRQSKNVTVAVKEVSQKKQEKTNSLVKSHLRQAFDLKLPITELTRALEEKGIQLTDDILPLTPEDAVDVMMHFLRESPSADMWAVLRRQRANGVVELINTEEQNFLQVAVSLNKDDQELLLVFIRRIVAELAIRRSIDSKQLGRLTRLFCHAIRFASILEAHEKSAWMRRFFEILLLKHTGHFSKCLAYCLVSDAFAFCDWLTEELEDTFRPSELSLAVRILVSADSDDRSVVNWLLNSRFQSDGISRPAPELIGSTFSAAIQKYLQEGDLKPSLMLARTGDSQFLHVAFTRLELEMKKLEGHFSDGGNEVKEQKHKSVFAVTSSSSSADQARKLTDHDAELLRKELKWHHAVLVIMSATSSRNKTPIMEALRKISAQIVGFRDVINARPDSEHLRGAIDELADLAGEFTNYPLSKTTS